MPTVLRIGPYRFHFCSKENGEPPHIHVARDDREAKFWLKPISVASNEGCRPVEIRMIGRLIERHCQELVQDYDRHHEQ